MIEWTVDPNHGLIQSICDPFWHSESDVARAEYFVSPIMP